MAVHCDEICNKIVTIMCDRLTTTTRDLIAMLSSAQSGHIGGQLSVHNTLPSAFAASTAKQLRILADILMSTSSEKDIRKILGTVLVRFTAALSAAYGGLELETAGLDGQVAADLVFLVNGLQALPLEPEEVKSASRQLVEIRDRYEAMARQQSQVAELRLKAAEQAALGSVVKEPPTAEPSSQGQAAVEETQEALTPEGRASHSEEERAEDAPPSDGEAAPGEAAPDPVEPTRVEAEVPQEDEQGGEALPDVTSTP